MTEPTTAEIRGRHELVGEIHNWGFGDKVVAHADRGILLDRLEAAEETIVCLKSNMPLADRLLNQRKSIGKLQATIAAISELPDKWLSVSDIWINGVRPTLPTHRQCANELQAIIGSKS